MQRYDQIAGVKREGGNGLVDGGMEVSDVESIFEKLPRLLWLLLLGGGFGVDIGWIGQMVFERGCWYC